MRQTSCQGKAPKERRGGPRAGEYPSPAAQRGRRAGAGGASSKGGRETPGDPGDSFSSSCGSMGRNHRHLLRQRESMSEWRWGSSLKKERAGKALCFGERMLVCGLQGMEGQGDHTGGDHTCRAQAQVLRGQRFGPVQGASQDRAGEEGQKARGLSRSCPAAHHVSAGQRRRGSHGDQKKPGTAAVESSSHGRVGGRTGR